MPIPLRVLLACLALLLTPVIATVAFGIAAQLPLLPLLGRASGVLGLMALLLASLLSSRRPGWDPPLGGLTTVWRLHHYLGIVAFLAVLLHPLLFAFALVERSPGSLNDHLWPALTELPIWFGWLSLLLLFVALTPSFQFWGRPHFQNWKRLHALAAAGVLFALAHAIFFGRALPSPWAGVLWLTIGALVLLSFVYRFWLAPRFATWHYRLRTIEFLAPDVAELILTAEHQPLRHRAGQFVYLRHFDHGTAAGFDEEHPYTISSAPDAKELRIGIKALGDASHATLHLPLGTAVTLEGPYGNFFLPDAAAPDPSLPDADLPETKLSETASLAELWIAGGIGITPFVGRLRSLALRPTQAHDIHLIYCVDRLERANYLPVLGALVPTLSGIELHLHYFQQHGVLDIAFLQAHCPDFSRRRVYLCGPPEMNRCVHRLLRGAGMPRRQIRSEEFNLL